MKKFLFLSMMLACVTISAYAQQYALIDMEYITNNIPEYQQANDKLNQASQKYQKEIETKSNEAKALYENYQKQAAKLTAVQKSQKENAILAKEKEAAELKKKYFGPEGEMYKMKENLVSPIENRIYEAVKYIAEKRGYYMIIDRASDNAIIFASPKIDISNEVLSKLGYSN